MKKKISRRDFVTTGAALSVGGLAACGAQVDTPAEETPPPTETPPAQAPEAEAPKALNSKGRVIILGFDGVEPSVVDAMLEAGRLPNLAKLKEQGVHTRLGSTIPPQSPTAWTSFTTCKNPGGHGIYDFIRRDPRSYFPKVGTGTMKDAKLAVDGSVKTPAEAVAYRVGDTFWAVGDRAGARCKVLNVPFVFPADELSNGVMLCGLGVPDLRGTSSMCFSFSEAHTETATGSGVIRVPLKFDAGQKAHTEIEGARDPRKPRTYVMTPVDFVADREAHTVTITAAGKTITLKQGEWSEWLEWTFQVTDQFTVRALSRFYALEVGEQVRVYMTCLQFHPDAPYVPFTNPAEYSDELEDRYGLFKTIGWAFDTHALRQDALSEDAFLEDTQATMAWRENLTLDELKRDDFDVLISVWTATDRVGHMFWRYRDPEHPMYDAEGAKKYGEALETTYEKMDDIVGKVMAELKDTDLLFVMSDHGFKTFRSGLNVNTWLVQNGYAAMKEGADSRGRKYAEMDWLLGVDWSKTKAYCVGLSSLYLNIKGREKHGIVDEADVPALLKELKDKLLQVTDPDTGAKVFSAIYTRDVYKGEALDDAPDISFGYAKPYNNTKSTAKGAAPEALFEITDDKWSGEHAASDVTETSGILFSNRALGAEAPEIIDMGVTVLDYLGVDVPEDFEGKKLV